MATLKTIVAAYLRTHAQGARRERDWYRARPTLQSAVKEAAFATTPRSDDPDDTGKDSHQWRISWGALKSGRARLLDARRKLTVCKSFDELHQHVHDAVSDIKGLGELYIYDTAVRIGAQLGLAPTAVYLHAGVRSGAKALGFESSRRTIEVREFPKEFQALEADDIESLLCIYRSQLSGAAIDARSAIGCRGGRAKRPRIVC